MILKDVLMRLDDLSPFMVMAKMNNNGEPSYVRVYPMKQKLVTMDLVNNFDNADDLKRYENCEVTEISVGQAWEEGSDAEAYLIICLKGYLVNCPKKRLMSEETAMAIAKGLAKV